MTGQTPGGATNSGIEAGTWARSLQILVSRGLRPGAFVDVGAADGYHGLAVLASGLLPGAQIVNIDANPLYEPSLRKIQAAVGGHYRISAVSDRVGTLELQSSAHPYWASAAAADDPYWETINQQRGQTVTVPCSTLDDLLAGMGVAAPYVLKLDIQGLEATALHGAPRTLADTAVLICEAMVHEFDALHRLITAVGFDLFDLTNLHRTQDEALGWMDTVYLHRNHAGLNNPRMWADERNAEVVQLQDQRRTAVLAGIDSILGQIRR